MVKLLSLKFLINSKRNRRASSQSSGLEPTGIKIISIGCYLFCILHRWTEGQVLHSAKVPKLWPASFSSISVQALFLSWIISAAFLFHHYSPLLPSLLFHFLTLGKYVRQSLQEFNISKNLTFKGLLERSSFFCPPYFLPFLFPTCLKPQDKYLKPLLFKVVSVSFRIEKMLRVVAVVGISQNKKDPWL